MLQDYPITQQPTKTSKLVAFIEFTLVLFAIQGVLLLFSQEVPTSEATQFRILANSNTVADQQVKQQVQETIAPLLEQAISHSATTQQMNDKLQLLEPKIIELATQQTSGLPVTFEYGAALIPPKRFGFAIQQQGVYDAYVLKIGKGKGDNWWCALFPNVCFPEEATVVETEEEPVTFFIWEWIKSWFS
ncbi:stage II sporulation protein R [Sporosarcina sp. GW1-11]|uniref:stage II sporulation protein R n=1 Tax=Sporosarcina sp. GW1-11 TaxID=2899126 RepID=UPI00294CD855|nr:stage II sporulation protein R [Sporosarcina sp. GW1-11]MDV6379172.1 stage II sporulation protein R [Sporosarcina sp. GW1-11]